VAAPRFIADPPVPLPGTVVRRGYLAGRVVTPLARAGDCLDNCQGLLQYCTDDNPAHDILCAQGRLCAEKCTCLGNALACSDYCLGAATVCGAACQDLACVLACNDSHNFCNAACAGYQYGCNAWAEATYGASETGSEPEDEITPTCRVEEVTVWINAFIPGDLPGQTLNRPGHPGETMLPDAPGPWGCFLTDGRGLSNDIDAFARSRLHLRVTVDANTNSFRDSWPTVGTTIEVDCNTGAVVHVGVADISPENILNTLRATDFHNLAPGLFTCRLDAEVSNPLVLFSPGITWSGNLAIGIFPFRTADGRTIELARIEFSGRVGKFPAFEMYASVNELRESPSSSGCLIRVPLR